jgi:hypothetical protein
MHDDHQEQKVIQPNGGYPPMQEDILNKVGRLLAEKEGAPMAEID